MTLTPEREEELWQERCTRLAKLCQLKAPRWVIIHASFCIIMQHGLRRSLWFWFHCHYLTRVRMLLWALWHKTILRKTPEQIDELLELEEEK